MKSASHYQISVRHRIQTRLRVKIPLLRNRPYAARELEQRLLSEPRLKSVTARPLTGSVILDFSSKEVRTGEALAILEKGLTGIEQGAVNGPRASLIPETQYSGNLRMGLFRVIALTGFTLYHFYRFFVLRSPLRPGWLVTGILLGGLALFRRAAADLVRGKFLSADTFLSAATILATATGEASAALEVLWVQELGRLLEDFIQQRSRKAIREVILRTPQSAFLLVEGREVETPVHDIQPGDVLVAHSPERIPVDGLIVQGEGLVDESHITGRAEPELKTRGDKVFAGTALQLGLLKIQAKKVGQETYLARVTRAIESSLAQKAMAEKKADKLAARLMGFGLGASAATFIFTRSLAKTLSVQLALASPCATVLAASSAITAALANAARNKILIKGGIYLERMADADCICLDKTGTLTGHLPKIQEIVLRSTKGKPEHIVAMAAAAQGHHTHPIASALRQNAQAGVWARENPLSCETVVGRGVRAEFAGDVLIAGNRGMMRDYAIDVSRFDRAAERLVKERCSLVYVARNNKAQGLIGLKYDLRPRMAEIVRRLRETGVKEIHVISGDEKKVVSHAAQELSATGWRGGLLPEGKSDYVAGLVRGGRTVVMVGDGVNDASALARADIGIAMGAGGAEAAVEAADIALVDNRLERIVFARLLSRQTLRIIEQNHWFAVTTDLLSAGLALAGLMPPILSGAAHILHTVLIFANSSRMYTYQPDVELEFVGCPLVKGQM